MWHASEKRDNSMSGLQDSELLDEDAVALLCGRLSVPFSPQRYRKFLELTESSEGVSPEEFRTFVTLQRQRLEQCFRELDTSTDGRICARDIEVFAARYGIKLSHDEIQRLLQHIRHMTTAVDTETAAAGAGKGTAAKASKAAVVPPPVVRHVTLQEFVDAFLLDTDPSQAHAEGVFESWLKASNIGALAVPGAEAEVDGLDPRAPEGKVETAVLLASGAAAGVLSRTATAPLDRIKTLLQAQAVLSGGASSSTCPSASSCGTRQIAAAHAGGAGGGNAGNGSGGGVGRKGHVHHGHRAHTGIASSSSSSSTNAVAAGSNNTTAIGGAAGNNGPHACVGGPPHGHHPSLSAAAERPSAAHHAAPEAATASRGTHLQGSSTISSSGSSGSTAACSRQYSSFSRSLPSSSSSSSSTCSRVPMSAAAATGGSGHASISMFARSGSALASSAVSHQASAAVQARPMAFAASAGSIPAAAGASAQPLQVTGILHGCREIMREGGVWAFWRGNGANVIKVAPETAAKWYAYEKAKALICEDPENVTVKERFAAGASAGAFAQALIYPMEVIKTRLAVAAKGTYKGIYDCFGRTLATEGPKGLYRGLGASVLGIIPYSGVEIAVFTLLKEQYERMYPTHAPGVGALLACGATATVCGQVVAYPLQLIRTRQQACGVPGAGGAGQRYDGLAQCLRETWKREKLRGLYRGLLPNMLKAVPSMSISYATYETAKRKLSEWAARRREQQHQQQQLQLQRQLQAHRQPVGTYGEHNRMRIA